MKQKILLGICGGIAAYKSAELVRLLVKQGCEVRVVMTQAAQQFITPLTLQALSGHPVYTEINDAEQEQAMSHIHLARWAEQLIIAPATANIIAKLANGIADDLLTTLYLVAECPVTLAPAMNQAMWRKPVVQDNLAKLQQHGVKLVGPEAGLQACGDDGVGRMSEAAAICAQVLTPAQPGALQDLKVLITAGPTREPLDPVRFISNRSSGKMGYALAQAALQAGARVTLISGPVTLTPPAGVTLLAVETAQQMHAAVMSQLAETDIYIGAAAVADYQSANVAAQKLKKHQNSQTLTLEKTVDIISEVAKQPNKPFTVGFAAETDDLESYAQNKLVQKNLDMIAANWVGKSTGGFESDQNALQVYWPGGQQHLGMTAKQALAAQLIALIAERFQKKPG